MEPSYTVPVPGSPSGYFPEILPAGNSFYLTFPLVRILAEFHGRYLITCVPAGSSK